MGMFDSVYVKCPTCGEDVEFQSKAGDCVLHAYQLGTDPIPGAIAGDLMNTSEICNCGAVVTIRGSVALWPEWNPNGD